MDGDKWCIAPINTMMPFIMLKHDSGKLFKTDIRLDDLSRRGFRNIHSISVKEHDGMCVLSDGDKFIITDIKYEI